MHALARQRPDQVGGENETADQDRHGDIGLERRVRDIACELVHARGDVGLGKQDGFAAHSPALAKRNSKWCAANGGLESRVRNFVACPGCSVKTAGTKVQ